MIALFYCGMYCVGDEKSASEIHPAALGGRPYVTLTEGAKTINVPTPKGEMSL